MKRFVPITGAMYLCSDTMIPAKDIMIRHFLSIRFAHTNPPSITAGQRALIDLILLNLNK